MREWEQVTGAFAWSLGRQASWFLKWGEGRGSLGGLSASLAVLCAGIMSRTLLLLQAPQKWQFVWSFGILLFTVCPKCSYIQLFLVPYSFVFEGMSVQVKALQQSIPGPTLCHSGESERKALISVKERNRSGGGYMLSKIRRLSHQVLRACPRCWAEGSGSARPGPTKLWFYESGPVPGHCS